MVDSIAVKPQDQKPEETGKPSELIEQIRQRLISNDYVQYGGNFYSRASWFQVCDSNLRYDIDAIITYLDEHQ